MLINRIRIYQNLPDKNTTATVSPVGKSKDLESLGNAYSSICCIVNCSQPLSESKDYKTLAKVFKKLMLNIENVYTVNIHDHPKTNFIHFIHEYDFKKIFIFGEDALMNNVPVRLEKLIPTPYEISNILLVENLNQLVSTPDEAYKKKCWEAIQSFYKS